MRRDTALSNLYRAEADYARQGWAYLEPQGDRSDWLRLPATGRSPSIHVNHEKRFTSHGEVCYEQISTCASHPVWGDFRRWWCGQDNDFPCIHRGHVLRQIRCGCGARDRQLNLHVCRLHGECTIHSSGKAFGKTTGTGRVPTCLTCKERQV